MPVTLVETPGAADANSYPTVEEFRAYWETRYPRPTWLADVASADEATIAALCVQGTRAIDDAFKWTGIASDLITQALCWPRNGMLTRNGGAIPIDVNPAALKNAVCEWAGQAYAKDLMADNDAVKQGIASVKAGSVSVSFQSKTSDKGSKETEVVLAGSNFFYLSVPDEVRRLLVPSWYEATTSLSTSRGIIFEAV